jgi:pimeloyl-ACP methyl ester carboxylesterase
MRHIFFILLFLSIALTACASQNAPQQATTPSLPLEKCPFYLNTGRQVDAKCGVLSVPENPQEPQGRKVRIHFTIVPARLSDAAADPVFMLAGGPGQSAISSFSSLAGVIFPVNQTRDIVLIDQRGTGKSNALTCLSPSEQDLPSEEIIERLQTCPNRLRLRADTRFYTTEIAMQDLDAVRQALGYERINLYGVSYGTRAALTYLRMYPQNVRTITLDAVVGPNFVLYMNASQDGQAALEAVFARCENDPDCQNAYPEVRSELNEILTQLEAAPVEITFAHPVNNAPVELTLTKDTFTALIFNILYVPDLAATLPLAIQSIRQTGDYLPLVTQAYLTNANISEGMFYAVACAEDAPLIQPEQAESPQSIFANRTHDLLKVCEFWQTGEVSADFRTLPMFDTPTLIFSGEADPITPPVHTEAVLSALPNHAHLILPGMGHGNLNTMCAVNIFADFLEAGGPAGLDTSCTERIAPAPFFINYNGPKP